MTDVPIKQYVDSRFDEMDKRVGALKEAHANQYAGWAIILSILSLGISLVEIAVLVIIETRK